MAQLPPSDEDLGLFADQNDPDFYLYGEKLPKSSDNVLKALGGEVVVPVTHFHPAQEHGVAGGSGARQLSRALEIAPGVPSGHQVPLHLRPGQLQVQGGVAGGSVTRQLSHGSAISVGVPPGHQVPLHLGPGQLQLHGVAGGSATGQLLQGSAISVGVPPGHQVPLHLGPGQLQLHRVAGGSATRQLSHASAPAVLPGHQLHLRPGHLQGVAVRSGPIRSPTPVVRRPPVAQQPDQMLRTVHLSPIPLGFHDTLQLKLQMEQLFGVNSIQELKLPIQHKGYGFVTFYVKETCDAAISRRTINLNLGQGTEADAISLKPARRR